MKYHQIEAFYHVMLTGSISQAAVKIGRTQPAVSMTINALEDQLCTKLFDRRAGRLIARSEAQVLIEQVGPIIEQLQGIRSQFAPLTTFPMPRISIISASNPGMQIVPNAIRSLAASGQDFRLMNGSSALIVSEIENQRHDIGVTDQGAKEIPLNSPLFEAEVFEVPVLAIFPEGLISENFDELTAKDLARYSVCCLYAQHGMAIELRGLLPSPTLEFESFFPMACYALANNSVAIVDALTFSTIMALTKGVFSARALPVTNAAASRYLLLRPKYRARSAVIDDAYKLIRNALAAHAAGYKNA